MRTDTLFGKTVNVVGDVSADLVLESLGKIYIKSRNKAQTLDEIISSLTSGSEQSIADKTIIVDGIDELEGVENGDFVYDKSSSILYIQVDGELVELISVSTQDTKYVKRSGDTMTGALTINTQAGVPPLKVNSAMLNKNFNSQYLNGLPSSAYAQKNKNEDIRGSWQFNNEQYFNEPVYYRANTLHYKDSLHNGSVGTPNFVSGFGGYGWRIDGQTNTLTIDYVVVRKAMYVYELVVNKVSATNGSLWVTNASKVEYACQLKLIQADSATIWEAINPNGGSSGENTDIRSAVYGMLNHQGLIVSQTLLGSTPLSAEQMASNQGDGVAKRDYNYKGCKVFLCKDESKISQFLSSVANQGDTFAFRESDFPVRALDDTLGAGSVYEYYDLFDPYFDTEVVMPVAIPKQGVSWYSNQAGKVRESVYDIKYVKTYHKYFGQKVEENFQYVTLTNLYLVKFDTDNLPVFKPGDLLRCQKFTGQGIKYYDAVVCNKLRDSIFIIQLAESIMDKTTTIEYDNNLNPTITVEKSENNKEFYNTTGYRSNDILGIVQEGDNLVQIGHLWDVTRQNAVYLTSSDDGSPYIDTMSEVNRPDYSVIYYTPTFETIKLYKGQALPYTGKYYIQEDEGISTGQYAIAYKVDAEGVTHCYSIELNKTPTRMIIWYKDGDNLYRANFDDLYDSTKYTDEQREAILSNPVRIQEEEIDGPIGQSTSNYTTMGEVRALISVTINQNAENPIDISDYEVLVLRGYPDEHTKLLTTYESFDLLLEDGTPLTTEDIVKFILEDEINNDTIVPTRTTKARFGRLDGIIDDRFDVTKQPHGFGLYGENVFLTGEFILSNGKNVAEFERDYLLLSSGLDQTSITFQSLRQDLLNLADNTPNYGNLESAGIFLKNNGIIIYGDSIQIITKPEEFHPGEYEGEMPTALFADGKINAKLLALYDLECLVPLYGTNAYGTGLNNQKNVTNLNIQTEYSDYFTANLSLHYGYEGVNSSFSLYQKKNLTTNLKETKYVKEFVYDQSHMWLYVDIWGDPIITTYEYKEDPTLASSDALETVTNITNVTVESPWYAKYTPYGGTTSYYVKQVKYTCYFAQYTTKDSEGNDVTYTWNPDTMQRAAVEPEEGSSNPTKEAFEEFQKQLSVPGLWNLHQDGVGNLGGNGLYWDMEGNLTVSGNIEAKSGTIGGFKISQTQLVRNEAHYTREYPKVKIGSAFEMYTYSEPSVFPKVTTTGKVVLDGNGLRLMNGDESDNSTREVYLSNKGLVWRDDKTPFEASSILFNLTVYSIASTQNNLTLPYAKMSYNSVISYPGIIANLSTSPFDRVNIYCRNRWVDEYVDGAYSRNFYSGDYFIYFPRLTDDAAYSAWMTNAIKSGRLIFSVTGLNALKTGESLTTAESYKNAINSGEPNFGDPETRPSIATAFISSFGFGHDGNHFGNYYTPKFIKEHYGQSLLLRPKDTQFPYDVNAQGINLLWAVHDGDVSNENLSWYYDGADSDHKSKFKNLYLFGKESNNYDSDNDNDTNLDNGIRILVRNGSNAVKGGFMLTAHYLQGSGIHNYTQLG